MRRIKKKEIEKGGKRYCKWCKQDGKRTEAIWIFRGDTACDVHKNCLDHDDGYMTEADYQTWGRL